MRKVTTVRPKELNLFNRNFGNLKKYALEKLPEGVLESYLQEILSERLFENGAEENEKFCKSVLSLLDEEYRQQIEDHLQIIIMSNDIILKNEYDDMKRKNIRCSRREKTTMDIIIEEFSSEAFIQYLCKKGMQKEQDIFLVKLIVQRLTKQEIIGDIYFDPEEEIQNIKLPESVNSLIDKVIKSYPRLRCKSKYIKTSFICKALITADMLLHGNINYFYLLSNEDSRYLDAVKAVLNRLEAWKNQQFFCTMKRKLEIYSDDFISKNNVFSKFEREFTEEEQQKFKEFLENNFLTNISFGILVFNENAITLFYKQEKEKQNIIKNIVVKLSERIKESLLEDLKNFDIHDLEKTNVSEEKKELATMIQLYMIDYKWLEVYVRDDQVKGKGVDVKAWNLYNNITKTVLLRSVPEFNDEQGRKILKKIVKTQRSYSLNDLCEKEFDEAAFWRIGIALETREMTKEQFIEEEQKKGVSRELIDMFFTLTEV